MWVAADSNSSTNAEKTYDFYREFIQDAPFEWSDGTAVEKSEYPLYFLETMFRYFTEKGTVHFVPLPADGEKTIDDLVMCTLTLEHVYNESHRRELHRRMGDAHYAQTGQRAAENRWPVVLQPLPNRSDIAWAYSPERKDYAGAMYLPPIPKKFMKPGREAGALHCILTGDFRKVMLDLAPH